MNWGKIESYRVEGNYTFVLILSNEWAPGIWAGTEGCYISVVSKYSTYTAKVFEVNLDSRVVVIEGNLNTKFDDESILYTTHPTRAHRFKQYLNTIEE